MDVAGAIALIGDAAHAMAPSAAQGGAQAIEDAWVLAQRLPALVEPSSAALADARAHPALAASNAWRACLHEICNSTR